MIFLVFRCSPGLEEWAVFAANTGRYGAAGVQGEQSGVWSRPRSIVDEPSPQCTIYEWRVTMATPPRSSGTSAAICVRRTQLARHPLTLYFMDYEIAFRAVTTKLVPLFAALFRFSRSPRRRVRKSSSMTFLIFRCSPGLEEWAVFAANTGRYGAAGVQGEQSGVWSRPRSIVDEPSPQCTIYEWRVTMATPPRSSGTSAAICVRRTQLARHPPTLYFMDYEIAFRAVTTKLVPLFAALFRFSRSPRRRFLSYMPVMKVF
ncbi:hypothetical protein J6590_034121 [Homalodisca vitripennis]|nr:hypothetical protein J6590_034121 [Homalodisca vitripennis]